MKRYAMLALSLVALVALMGNVVAADDKNDPTGTWKWTPAAGGGGGGKGGKGAPREMSLKLKLEGDKLTGSMPGRNNDTNIEEGTYKNGEISFKITRERNGNKTTTTYKAKIEGDTLKGTIDRGSGEPMKWEAKRSKD